MVAFLVYKLCEHVLGYVKFMNHFIPKFYGISFYNFVYYYTSLYLEWHIFQPCTSGNRIWKGFKLGHGAWELKSGAFSATLATSYLQTKTKKNIWLFTQLNCSCEELLCVK